MNDCGCNGGAASGGASFSGWQNTRSNGEVATFEGPNAQQEAINDRAANGGYIAPRSSQNA